MNCKNCGHSISGKFCSHCGQNSNVDRINLSNFLHEISEGIFKINKGFFYTLRELTVRPGHSLEEFLNGKRKNHFKPIAYVLTLSTLYFVITQITNQVTWIDDGISGWLSGATDQPEGTQVSPIFTWLSKHYAYTTLLFLPVFSLASYLSFRKFRKNYLEHIVINAYITGHQAILYSIFALIGVVIKSDVIVNISLLMAMSYTCWVFYQFFSAGKPIINILRSILTYFLYLIGSTVLLIALLGITEL